MSIQHIRDKYHLPVKIGSIIRLNGEDVKVVWSPDAYLTVRLPNGKKETRHPFDFDYQIDGAWRSGDDLKGAYDASWHRWNRQLSQPNLNKAVTNTEAPPITGVGIGDTLDVAAARDRLVRVRAERSEG